VIGMMPVRSPCHSCKPPKENAESGFAD